MTDLKCPCCGQTAKGVPWLLDLGTGILRTLAGDSETLSPKEALLLDALLRGKGKALGTGLLAEALWDSRDEPEDAAGNIKVHIVRLRKKLAPIGVVIETTFGVGYRIDPHQDLQVQRRRAE